LRYQAKSDKHFKSPPGWSPQELGVGGKKKHQAPNPPYLKSLLNYPPITVIYFPKSKLSLQLKIGLGAQACVIGGRAEEGQSKQLEK